MRIYSIAELKKNPESRRCIFVVRCKSGEFTAHTGTAGSGEVLSLELLLTPEERIAFGILESDLIAAALESAPEEKARGEAIRAEIERRAAKRAAALSKLDDEEREMLGVRA